MGRLNMGGSNPCAQSADAAGRRLQKKSRQDQNDDSQDDTDRDPCAPSALTDGGRRRLQKKGRQDQNADDAQEQTGGDGESMAPPSVPPGCEPQREDLVQQILVAALVDTLVSVLVIFAIVATCHLLVLVWWKFRANRLYYTWTKPEREAVIVRVDNTPINAPIGMDFYQRRKGQIIVSYVAEGSPFVKASEAMIAPGDRLLCVNGQVPNTVKMAKQLINESGGLYLLVLPGSEEDAKAAAVAGRGKKLAKPAYAHIPIEVRLAMGYSSDARMRMQAGRATTRTRSWSTRVCNPP